jgi:hypothetical protein
MTSETATVEVETIGIKEEELRKMAECDICGQKVGSGQNIFFYRVRVDQVILDLRNLQEQQGLGMMLDPALAMVMGPNKDLAHRLPGNEKTVCGNCTPKIGLLLDD